LLSGSSWFINWFILQPRKMEVASYSKTFVEFITRCIPEDRILHIDRCKNLKSCEKLLITNENKNLKFESHPRTCLGNCTLPNSYGYRTYLQQYRANCRSSVFSSRDAFYRQILMFRRNMPPPSPGFKFSYFNPE
jgi:hypothetical protein